MCKLRVRPSAEFSTALDSAEGGGISFVNNFVTFLIDRLKVKLKLSKKKSGNQRWKEIHTQLNALACWGDKVTVGGEKN